MQYSDASFRRVIGSDFVAKSMESTRPDELGFGSFLIRLTLPRQEGASGVTNAFEARESMF